MFNCLPMAELATPEPSPPPPSPPPPQGNPGSQQELPVAFPSGPVFTVLNTVSLHDILYTQSTVFLEEDYLLECVGFP